MSLRQSPTLTPALLVKLETGNSKLETCTRVRPLVIGCADLQIVGAGDVPAPGCAWTKEKTRTARGKAQARMNALRTGDFSRLRQRLLVSLLNAPPGGVARLAHALLTPEMAFYPPLQSAKMGGRKKFANEAAKLLKTNDRRTN
jgi:hypothetical protein